VSRTAAFAGEAVLALAGLTFAAWRQQVRLVDALRRLAEGQAVTNVALDLGYQSPSAFTNMFRRALGRAPTRYFMET